MRYQMYQSESFLKKGTCVMINSNVYFRLSLSVSLKQGHKKTVGQADGLKVW